MLRFRLARPETVVDINGIDSLDYLREENGFTLGALARHADVENSATVADRYGASPTPRRSWPIRRSAIAGRSSVRSRRRTRKATGERPVGPRRRGRRPRPRRRTDDPRGRLLPVALRHDARGGRTRDRTPGSDARAAGGSAYHKLKRKTGDYAMAGVAARLVFDDDGRIADAGSG